MSVRTADEWLRDAVGVSSYRDAEQAFARWLLAPDMVAALLLVDDLSLAQARRLGFSLGVAMAARLLTRRDAAELLAALQNKVGVPAAPTGTLREKWLPDMAFDTSRLRQRVAEASRRVA